MSWHYSQALVEGYLAESCLDGEQCAQLSGNHTPSLYLFKDRMKAFSRLSRSGMTLEPLTEQLGEGLLMWYLGDSLAKTSVVQERGQVLMEKEVQCGITCSESSMKCNQDSASLKTASTLELRDLSPSYKGLPKRGMMLSGMLYPLKTVEQAMKGKECGLLLPTPNRKHDALRGNGQISQESIREQSPEFSRGLPGGRERYSEEAGGSSREDIPTTDRIRCRCWWEDRPPIHRMDDGVAFGMDRLKAIGNGQVPIVAATAWKQLIKAMYEGV